jgi:uncharacterized membrane protein
MPDIEALLTRWQSAGILDAETAARIRAHEVRSASGVSADTMECGTDRRVSGRQAHVLGIRWQGITALILGAILLACGVVLFVSAHWEQLGPGARFAVVLAMVAVFHIGGGLARRGFQGMSSALHAVGTVATGAAIALVGQIFSIEEHWPVAVLLWALAAIAGWMLLRDQAQQILALLLVPSWIICELSYRMEWHIGSDVYIGRLFFVGAILYVTFFLGSRRKAVEGILFAAGAIAAIFGVVLMQTGWASLSGNQTFIPFSTRVWAWIAIAALPLIVAAFHGHKGLTPVAAAIAFAIALPWCYRSWTESFDINGVKTAYARTEPNMLAHPLVAAFALFICWWGVRVVSRALVNLGIAGFAVAVGWFYFSDIYDKVGRSLGLIGLGILFLAGGWVLEMTRRRLLAGIADGRLQGRHAAEADGSAR